jgi:hypothetical protein
LGLTANELKVTAIRESPPFASVIPDVGPKSLNQPVSSGV